MGGAFKCKGVFVDSFAIATLEGCIEKCGETEDCAWFTLEKSNDHCILYEECDDQFDCETCASGEKKCAHGYKGTTPAPATTSGMMGSSGYSSGSSWSSGYSSGSSMSYSMYGGGYSSGYGNYGGGDYYEYEEDEREWVMCIDWMNPPALADIFGLGGPGYNRPEDDCWYHNMSTPDSEKCSRMWDTWQEEM